MPAPYRPKKGLLVAFFCVCAALLALLGSQLWLASEALFKPADGFADLNETPLSRYGLAFEEVTAVLEEGDAVRGWLIPSNTGSKELAVLVVHGRFGSRKFGLERLPMLQATSAAVLAMDLRGGTGRSDGHGLPNGLATREAVDVAAMVAELKQRHYEHIVILGCSLGSSAALLAAAQDPTIAGVIAEAPLASFPLYAARAPARQLLQYGLPEIGPVPLWGAFTVWLGRQRHAMPPITAPLEVAQHLAPRPVLLLHGTNDTMVAMAHSELLLQAIGPSATLTKLEGAAHCRGLQKTTRTYREAILGYLNAITP